MILVSFLFLAIRPAVHAQLVETNIAKGKATFGDVAFNAPTSRGVDGIDGTVDPGNWTHADYPNSAVPYPGEVDVAPNPYWEVDLGSAYDLTKIQLVDRVDCCDPHRLNGSTITLFDEAGSPIGSSILVDGLATNNPAETAVMDFNNAGAGWTGVARIRIDGLASNQYFQFSEFRAFSMQPAALPNAALGATVTTSGPTWPNQGAEKITDGDLTTQSHPQAELGTLGFTYSIDLGKEYQLEEILIHNRADGCCPERLSNYRVSLHDDDGSGLPGALVWTADVRTDGSNSGSNGIDRLTPDLDADGVFKGRHIMVENLSDDPYSPQIAELEALTLDEIPVPRVNLALGAVAGYFDAGGVGVPTWNGLPASNVTDGSKGSISHPLDEISDGYYLEIDLGSMQSVGTVEVTGRLDACCVDRLEDAKLELLDDGKNVVFSQIMSGQVTTTQVFEAPGGATAQFVRITNANGASYGPQIADVMVYAPSGDQQLIVELESALPSSGMVTLTFNSASGATYLISASSSLEDGSWAEIIDSVASQGELTSITITDTAGIGQPRRFYRVERE